MLSRLKAVNPEPWGIANGLAFAEKLGLADRVISFNYGRIEGEPSFPMTNFGGDTAYDGGKGATARGVMGNAQTHCVQLPNTFAFARGATGQSLTEEDYIKFAEDLVPNQGRLIVQCWRALSSANPSAMRELASTLEALPAEKLAPGRLKGLLFGSPRRFVLDLVMQLRFRAAGEEFRAAAEKNADLRQPFRNFVAAAVAWQRQHGYENAWWSGYEPALQKLNSPAINAVLGTQFSIDRAPDPKAKETPFEQVQNDLRRTESYTTRLLAAMQAVAELP